MISPPPDLNPAPLPPPPDPLATAAQDARSQWQRLWLRIQGTTPKGLARGLLIAVVVIAVGWLLWNAWGALLPFMLGALLAYALLPVVNWTDRFLPRPLGSILVVIATLALIVLVTAVSVPILIGQVGQLTLTLPTGERAQARIADLTAYLQTLPLPVQTVIRTTIEQQYAKFQASLPTLVEGLVAAALNSALRVANVVAFVLGLLVSFPWVMAVINAQPLGVKTAQQMLPSPMREDVWAIVRIVDRALRAFISGQVVLGIATGLLMFAGVWTATRLGWIGDSFPGLIGVFVGLTQLIPAFGPYLGAVAVLLLGLLVSWERAFILLGIYLLVLFVVNLLLGDRITRRVIPAHPVLVAVIVVAISQLGLVWVLFAAPIIAIVRDTVRYIYGRLSQPPRPAGVLPSQPMPVGVNPSRMVPAATATRLAPPPRRVVASGVRYPPRPLAPPLETDRNP